MTVPYRKPALTYEEQADLLMQRGLEADRDVLLRRLRAVGYYRFCAYWHPFKQPDSTFVPGTTLETVWQRYSFDRLLRLAVMDAMERVEVAVRCALVDTLALRHGPFAHLNVAYFPNAAPGQHRQFRERMQDDAQRSRELFVAHLGATYDEFPDLPIWAAAEIMSFGTTVTVFRMSHHSAQKTVAARFGLTGKVLSSWLLTLNYVRNLCAHHSRLWNRELGIRPMIPDARHDVRWHQPVPVTDRRLFVVLTQLRYLLAYVAPRSGWGDRLYALFNRYPDIPIAEMGMPADWRQHKLWR